MAADGLTIDTCMQLGIPLPLDIRRLHDLIRAAGPQGRFQAPVVRQTVAIPSGDVRTMTFPVPTGHVAFCASNLTVRSDYYHKDLALTFYRDDSAIDTPTGVPLTEPLDIALEHFTPVTRQFRVALVNGALAQSAQVTVTFEYLALEKSYYESFYRPLVQAGYRALEALVAQIEGGSR